MPTTSAGTWGPIYGLAKGESACYGVRLVISTRW